jgi:Uma2 family endonuclease
MSTTTRGIGSDAGRSPALRLPPLQNGDHLTAEDFERRYDAMPDLKKAELIEGVVFMGSPVSTDEHGAPEGKVGTWLGVYEAFTPGTQSAHNATLRLDKQTVPQPDVLLRILPEFGGRTTTKDGYVVGGPELTTEVSASSASHDLHQKLQVFWRHGVQEYIVWRVWDHAIDWFIRGENQFERLTPDRGIYQSRAFPGLWLDAEALLAGNMVQVLAVLQQGLATPEHTALCARLQEGARQHADQAKP